LTDGRRLVAIDIWGMYRNAVAHDVASFLNALLMLRLTRPAPWRGIARLGTAFVEGYGSLADEDRAAIRFLQAVNLPDIALEIAGRRRSTLARRWLGRVLRGVVETLITTDRFDAPQAIPCGADGR
jgi:hypothetical protein